MPTMRLRKPTQISYGVQLPGALSTALNGPASLSRADVARNPFTVKARWVFDGFGFQYIRSLYRACVGGSVSVVVALIVNRQALTDYRARFVPGSFELVSVEGCRFTVQASLEVEQNG